MSNYSSEMECAKVLIVNETGLQEIREWLATNHKRAVNSGEGASYFNDGMLRAWADEAEFQLGEGNPASIELKASESVTGHTQTFTISDAGLSAWRCCAFG